MVKEKSGVSVNINCKDKKLVVYDKDGQIVGTLRLNNRSWKVCGEKGKL